MATGTYTLIITLNVNRLKALTKRHKLTIDNENKTHIYAAYKRLTLDLGTHTDWKWGDGKRYSMQMESKRKLK